MGVRKYKKRKNLLLLYDFSYTPFSEDKPTNTQRILFSLANTLIFMGFVITATIILIVLYKFKCYKVYFCIKHNELSHNGYIRKARR